jgi:amidase/aspartyl-tRNA(Asn)/glutamyl-tRNA(Gln) amidotransferase subunit A
MIPLAPSFDAPGLIAPTVAHLRRVDMAVVNRQRRQVTAASPTGSLADLHLLVPIDTIAAGQTDPDVLDRFEQWRAALATAGVRISEIEMPMLSEAGMAAREGLVIAVEAYDWHRDLIAAHLDRYDPRVGSRILQGAAVLAADYVAALRRIDDCRDRYDAALGAVDADAVVTPTVPVLPPRVADLQSMDAYLAANTEVMRLTEFANRLDLPSVSLPGDPEDREPIGLMITGRRGGDAALLDLAALIETCLVDGE